MAKRDQLNKKKQIKYSSYVLTGLQAFLKASTAAKK